MKYQRIIEAVFNTPWAITPDKYQAICELIKLRSEDKSIENPQIAAGPAEFKTDGAVAVIPVIGTIVQRSNMFSEFSGGTSAELIGKQVEAAVQNNKIKSIVMDIDSPGGSVFGVQELADKIFQARQQKPIVAVANSLAASAAYWIGSSASEFVITPSGQAGSIGVLAQFNDMSAYYEKEGIKTEYVYAGKYKVEGNDTEPLSDEARASMQATVDEYYTTFVNTVARNRGVSSKDVRNGFGEGRVLTAKNAKAEGMVDTIATLEQTISRLSKSGSRSGVQRAKLNLTTI